MACWFHCMHNMALWFGNTACSQQTTSIFLHLWKINKFPWLKLYSLGVSEETWFVQVNIKADYSTAQGIWYEYPPFIYQISIDCSQFTLDCIWDIDQCLLHLCIIRPYSKAALITDTGFPVDLVIVVCKGIWPGMDSYQCISVDIIANVDVNIVV